MTMSSSPPVAIYRVSALGRAALTMWRGWVVLVPVTLLNAVIQAAISSAAYSPESVVPNIVQSIVSALIALGAIAFLSASALSAVRGEVSWRKITRVIADHWRQFLAWALALGAIAIIGFSLWTAPGILVLALTPYVLIAVWSGSTKPLAQNFALIKLRFSRWLITTIIIVLLAAIMYLSLIHI